MCRIIDCFDIDTRENTALDTLHALRGTRDDVKVRIYTGSLYRLDARIVDWLPVTEVMTGARQPEWVHNQRIFTTEKQLLKTLRQWNQKNTPDELGHSEAARALWLHGMIAEVALTKQQQLNRGKAWHVNRKFAISAMGMAYLAWLEMRETERHAAEDALYRDQWQTAQETRLVMAGW